MGYHNELSAISLIEIKKNDTTTYLNKICIVWVESRNSVYHILCGFNRIIYKAFLDISSWNVQWLRTLWGWCHFCIILCIRKTIKLIIKTLSFNYWLTNERMIESELRTITLNHTRTILKEKSHWLTYGLQPICNLYPCLHGQNLSM